MTGHAKYVITMMSKKLMFSPTKNLTLEVLPSIRRDSKALLWHLEGLKWIMCIIFLLMAILFRLITEIVKDVKFIWDFFKLSRG